MRILITGGAGFIGSYLAEAYLKRGDEVYVIDDLSTGNLDNIKPLMDNHKFHFVNDTVLNRLAMLELTGICEVVAHLAAAVGVRLIIDDPLKSLHTNIVGTEIVLDLANKFRKKVFLASTSEVYGRNSKVPLNEEDNRIYGSTTVARWSYASSKALDEFLGLAYWKIKRLPVTVARFFNTVGPRQTGRYGMVIPRFVGQALRNEPITVYGDGTQTRNFTYVGDVVRCVMALIDEPRAVGEIFNIGGEGEISINDLAGRVKQLLLARKERVAARANFNADVALVRRAGFKRMTARADHVESSDSVMASKSAKVGDAGRQGPPGDERRRALCGG